MVIDVLVSKSRAFIDSRISMNPRYYNKINISLYHRLFTQKQCTMGLRLNIGKTKVMKCNVAANMQVESGKYPCGICGKGVGRNSIQCVQEIDP